MSTPVTNSAPTSIPSFVIGSPDDAVSVMDAVQISLTDNIRNSIQQNVSAASRLLEALSKVSNAAYALYKGLTSTVTPVTVASLESTPRTSESLQALFLGDGPMLGNNLQEANDTYDLLTALGVPVNAPVITPVLVAIDSMDGSPPAKAFAWYGESQLADVKKIAETVPSPYPGSASFVKTTTDASGKVTQTITFTTFDSYANRRDSAAASFTNLVLLVNLAAAIQLLLATELANAAKQADKLDDVVDENRNAVKDEESTLNQRRTARDEQLAEALRQLRVLKAEREELRARAKSKVLEGTRTGDASIGKNKDDDGEPGARLGQSVAEAARAIRDGRSFQFDADFPGKTRGRIN